MRHLPEHHTISVFFKRLIFFEQYYGNSIDHLH